jgi:2-polyprenyl-3-methyl-5-hydroxy-6-metoxy-1,4-benzoquinol methylase
VDAVRFHNSLARQWESKYSNSSAFRLRVSALEKLTQDMTLSSSRWLDAGCGSGHLATWLHSRGVIVSCIDLSEEMLRQLPPFLRDRKVASVEATPYPPGYFDGIVCSSVIEYLRSPYLALGEFRRVLRPGGRLIVSVPNRASPLRCMLRACCSVTGLPKYMRFSRLSFTVDRFTRILANCGFHAVGIEHLGPSLPVLKSMSGGNSLVMFSCVKT